MDKNIKMKDIKELGEQLGELQRVCREKKIPVMIAFEGYGAAGKGLQIGNLILLCGVSGRRSRKREELRFLIPAGTGEL